MKKHNELLDWVKALNNELGGSSYKVYMESNIFSLIFEDKRLISGTCNEVLQATKAILARVRVRNQSPRRVFVLFQTDVWKTHKSRVFFGVFSSFEAANQAAKDNDLYTPDGCVDIVDVELDKFEEV